MYAIRVAVFDKGSPADCSDSFRVLASGTPIGDSTSSDDDDGDAGATDDGTNDPSPAPSTVPSGEEGDATTSTQPPAASETLAPYISSSRDASGVDDGYSASRQKRNKMVLYPCIRSQPFAFVLLDPGSSLLPQEVSKGS